MGVSRQAVSRWVNDSNEPDIEMLARIARATRQEFIWLAGEGANLSAPQTRSPAIVEALGDEFGPVPEYDIRVHAGPGAYLESDGEPLHHELFRLRFLRRLSRASLADLALLRVSGDSMWDTLHDGDQVLVDRTITAAHRDGLYVLLNGSELMVKRVQALPKGLLRIKSDNPRYDSFDVEAADIAVRGRVLWIGRAAG